MKGRVAQQVVESGDDWGLVMIARGAHRGRVAWYDDDSDDDVPDRAIIYFGDIFRCKGYYIVRRRDLVRPTTRDLWRRHEEISRAIGIGGSVEHGRKRSELLDELALINDQLLHRADRARLSAGRRAGAVFLSHATVDKAFAIELATDLKEYGYRVWLDSWVIRAGDSIPERLEAGLRGARSVAVILSEAALRSKWVEREWQAKYWEEIEKRRARVIPVRKEQCVVPLLLRSKKYADFATDYSRGLQKLLEALAPHSNASRRLTKPRKLTGSDFAQSLAA